jgi:hypothetical protein
MIHSRAGTMRQYVARARVGWVLQQAGNVNGVTYCDADGFGNRRGHEAIQKWLGSRHAGGKAPRRLLGLSPPDYRKGKIAAKTALDRQFNPQHSVSFE